jgi:hypothetical protein
MSASVENYRKDGGSDDLTHHGVRCRARFREMPDRKYFASWVELLVPLISAFVKQYGRPMRLHRSCMS